jgi:hypothetical protein
MSMTQETVIKRVNRQRLLYLNYLIADFPINLDKVP